MGHTRPLTGLLYLCMFSLPVRARQHVWVYKLLNMATHTICVPEVCISLVCQVTCCGY